MIPKTELNLEDFTILDKHIIDNFVDYDIPNKELEVNKDIYWVEGFMCAICSSSKYIKMDDWLPYVNGECVFESNEHASNIMSLILGLQSETGNKLHQESYEPLYKIYNLKNETEEEMVTKWCKGYMFGTILSNGNILAENSKLIAILTPIMAFAGTQSKEELEKEGTSPEQLISKIPLGVKLARELYKDSRNNNEEDSFLDSLPNPISKTIVNDNKIGRNDPCPCGSGKKYKKCCYLNDSTVH